MMAVSLSGPGNSSSGMSSRGSWLVIDWAEAFSLEEASLWFASEVSTALAIAGFVAVVDVQVALGIVDSREPKAARKSSKLNLPWSSDLRAAVKTV